MNNSDCQITERDMTLGMNWDGRDFVGWYVSVKLVGCRAYWDGERLWSRNGKAINAPEWFLQQLPAGTHLDGEIWCGLGGFQAASNAVRYGGKHWSDDVMFIVFDAPQINGCWKWRLSSAGIAVGRKRSVKLVPFLGVVTDQSSLQALLFKVREGGGEGLMLRNPEISSYKRKRTDNLLKVKRWPR